MPRVSNCLLNGTLGKDRAVGPKFILLPALRLRGQLVPAFVHSLQLSITTLPPSFPSPQWLQGRFREESAVKRAGGRVVSGWGSGPGQRSSARN